MNLQYTIDLLHELIEFLEPYVDVTDGSDGPRPNKAMYLKASAEQEIRLLEREIGRTSTK